MIEITQRIAIVGAGLCGSLLAINLAQRGFNVHVFEKRHDLRKSENDSGRSINLALSNRGFKALAQAGIDEEVRKLCIPMEGRLIHDDKGNKRFSPYSGRDDEYINSISRTGLNALLLDKAETYPNVNLYFDARVNRVDVEDAVINYDYLDQNLEESFDIVLGTDGAGSQIRASLNEYYGIEYDYSSDMLDYGYKELEIPANADESFKIESNALHIWPRGHFMIIALPNLDGSFTVTMFNPYKGKQGFESLQEDKEIMDFFQQYFPDLVDLLPALQDDFDDHPVGKLGTVKCYPWQAKGKVMILGDAAHAIVPFYGQGMNASFEDVYIFDNMLSEFMNSTWAKFCIAYQEARKKDTDAIADLALDNFQEMQDKVDDPEFIAKRKLEMELEKRFDDYYSKYSLVTFRDEMSYSKAMEQGRAQDDYLLNLCKSDHFEQPNSQEAFQEIYDTMKKSLKI